MTPEQIALLSTEALDVLIKDLGAARAQRPEPHPANAPDAIEFTAVDPAWSSHTAPNGFQVLRLRHNSFGWLQFALPPLERANLACYWLRQALITGAPAAPTAAAPPPPAPPHQSGGGTVH
jgi:hypothetical protein